MFDPSAGIVKKPYLTSSRSTPFSPSICARFTVSSTFQLSVSFSSSNQSVADILRNRGISFGMVCLVRSTISRVRRVRFSKLPPYSSILLLLAGERNEWRR